MATLSPLAEDRSSRSVASRLARGYSTRTYSDVTGAPIFPVSASIGDHQGRLESRVSARGEPAERIAASDGWIGGTNCGRRGRRN